MLIKLPSAPSATPATPRPRAPLRRRLEGCLHEVGVRTHSAKWATEALRLLARPAVTASSPRLSRLELNDMRARCHVALGKEAFLKAERRYWRRPVRADSPDLSCQFQAEFFAPANRAMSRRSGGAAKTPAPSTSHANALKHFERANALWVDDWQAATPRNFTLANVWRCDPAMPSFYLGVIALRQNDFTGARAHFERVRTSARFGPYGTAKMVRHQLRVTAAVFEAAAAMLDGQLDDAENALKRATRIDSQNINLLRNQGCLCERQGKRIEATAWYREVLSWEPDDGYAFRRLAERR